MILNLIKGTGCSNDDIRIVRSLISNTILHIKIDRTIANQFVTTLGSFPGDSLTGKLFTLYLTGALNHHRAITTRSNPPIAVNLIPLEIPYVDGSDFIDEKEENLRNMLPIIEKTFKE